MRKHLYLIKKQKIKSWLKFWLLTRDKVNYILSEIVEGIIFNLQNTVKRYFKIFNIFGNSVQDGTPTPTNPVPIESVADDVNLFDLKNYLSERNVSYTENEDGSLTFNSSIALYNQQLVFSDTNKTVSLSGIITEGTATNVRIQLLNESDTTVGEINSSVLKRENLSANKLRFNYSTAGTITMKNIKLQKGTVATPYSPYNYGTFTIDFEGQTDNYNYTFITKPLRSLPNGVRDSLEDDGIHRRGGRQTGTLSQTTTITLSDAKTNGAYMCNIKPSGTLTGKTIELEAGDYEIIYELAEEVIEPYTEEQQEQYNKIKELYTFDGTTNISSDDEVPPYLQIQYYMKGE